MPRSGSSAPAPSGERALERIRMHFLSKARKGQILNAKELLSYAKSKGVREFNEEDLRLLRRDWKFTAMYQKVKSPKEFISTVNYRYGVCQVDLGFMPREIRTFNRDCWGFIVCVEVTSLQVAIEPVPSKSRESWNQGLKNIVQTSSIHKISTLLSDRERALTSRATIETLKNDFGIRMVFLKARNKAYYAELFIGLIKRMLGMSMRYARKRGDDDAANWIRFLKPIANHLNSRKVPGTNFRRKNVNEFNYIDMLDQKYGGEAYAHLNTGSVSGSRLKKEWGNRLFKFNLRDRVLVDRRALTGRSRKKLFDKASTEGGYSPRIHVVMRRKLVSGKPGRYVPVYRLRQQRRREWEKELFYQTDLQKLSAYQADQESESADEEGD